MMLTKNSKVSYMLQNETLCNVLTFLNAKIFIFYKNYHWLYLSETHFIDNSTLFIQNFSYIADSHSCNTHNI